MTDKITGATRLQKIARALLAFGPLPLQGIRKHVITPKYSELHEMLELGYVVVTGKVAPVSACGIKEMAVYKITDEGEAFAEVEAQPKMRGPGKKPPKPKLARMDNFDCRTALKTTAKLTPRQDVEVTVTEKTKFTKYEPKFTYQTYQQPKHFMECVR